MKNACIVGYGAIAPSHVEAIKNTSCANLYGICDNNQNHLGKSHVTKAHQYYSDFNEMLKDQSVDVVHICAPHYLHKKMAICAMQAGKDVVLEKPAAISLKELEELISVKDSTHRHICYVLQNRTNKCIIKLKAIVDTHKYGKIIGVFGSLTWNRSAKYYTSSEWKGSFQREGGSLLINQAIHLVDMISYICGGIRSVQGSLSVTKLKNVIETEDTATLLLYLNNDVNGCVFATNTYACDEPYRIEIRFEEKTLYYMNGCLYALEGSVLELLETDDDKSKSGKKCWGSGHAKVINQFYDFLENQEGHYRELDKVELSCDEHRNRHILFRKRFYCDHINSNAVVYISADDYYKLYINGKFVGQGPAPSYHFKYNYNVIDISEYLKKGNNTIAVHTLYQGMINRVWQSGDNRHGLIMDLEVEGEVIVSSDESFKVTYHTGYRELGICGYDTQFLEEYNSTASEVGFELPDYNDESWDNAKINSKNDHILYLQNTPMLEFQDIVPVKTIVCENKITYDFGSNYVGYLFVNAQGHKGDKLIIRCAQELNDDGSLRYNLRANCIYEESWILSDEKSVLDWFDYKSFRYTEISFPDDVKIEEVLFKVRHNPFILKAKLKPEYSVNLDMKKIWELCVHTQKYGVQEVIQDCMEREKGFYLGDGCYTALTNMILTDDDTVVRKLIDDAFLSTYITDTIVCCLDCSFMQEIAEFSLMLVFLVLWHYRYTGDKEYLAENYTKVKKLLNAYHRDYEKEYLLRNLDKWCVVEWPKNFQHEYDVDVVQGKVCSEAHISINAYYIAAVRTANEIAGILELPIYRDEAPLMEVFYKTFFNPEKNLFKDGENTQHISLVGNSFVYAFGICEKEEFQQQFIKMLREKGIDSLSLFCTFPVLMGAVKNNQEDLLKECLLNEGAWLRIIREDGTTTFEGWGKDTKWNTSLFHMTMSYAATFMADINLKEIFGNVHRR